MRKIIPPVLVICTLFFLFLSLLDVYGGGVLETSLEIRSAMLVLLQSVDAGIEEFRLEQVVEMDMEVDHHMGS